MLFRRSSLLFLTIFFLTLFSNLSADPYCCWEEPQPCCCCWQGFYVSGQIGAGWVREHAKYKNANFFNSVGPVRLGSNFHFRSNQLAWGGAVGYNYQMGCFVIGVEGGALSLRLKQNRHSPFFPTDRYSSSIDWMADAKARIGWSWGCFLPFISGGWSGGYVRLTLKDPIERVRASSRKWTNGWNVGGGIDYKWSDCLSLGIAYNYNEWRHRHRKISCSRCGTGIGLGTPRVTNRLRVQTAVIRLNYIFDLNNLFMW